ncbi:MAG: MraY family glycosyltransferase [Vicinamibacterales bacterium]|nr:MraY family glycosyltransferase [Vicinamibacterales bacterium]
MTTYWWLAGLGAVGTLVLTPLVTRASTRLGLVDAPGGRKVHATPVPRLGGVAVAAAAGLALASAALLLPGVSGHLGTVAPILIGAALVFLVGLWDDARTAGPWPKLAVESAAAVVVMAGGLLIERVTLAGVTWQLGWMAWPMTWLWIVGLTNAFNLIDGIDGLASGIAVIAGATCGTMLILRGHPGEAMLVVAATGAAAGFLVYNFNPASIFLGDSGSLLFGFLLATTALAGWQKGATALAAGVPLLIFALPITDTAAALARRLVRPGDAHPRLGTVLGRVMEPDRDHIHHRLLALGLSERRVVLLLYGVSMALSLLALATARVDG